MHKSAPQRTKMMSTISLVCFVVSVVGALFLLPILTFASTSQGTISLGSSYAWGENIGWVNFAPSVNGEYVGVSVSDTTLTGYAWSSIFGWINLSPTNSAQGVQNDNNGSLSGSAWVSGLGWLSMDGVQIGTDGVFTGTAGLASTTVGRLSFGCTHCYVVTDWRPASLRSSGTPTPSTGGSQTSSGSSEFKDGTEVNTQNTLASFPRNTLPDGVTNIPQVETIRNTLANDTVAIVGATGGVETMSNGDRVFSLVQKNGMKVAVTIPAELYVNDDISITITPELLHEENAPHPDSQVFLINGNIFSIEARDKNGQPVTKFKKAITVSIDVPENVQGDSDVMAFYLDERDPSQLTWLHIDTATVQNGTVVFTVDHLTRFAIFKNPAGLTRIETGVGARASVGFVFAQISWMYIWILLLGMIVLYRTLVYVRNTR